MRRFFAIAVGILVLLGLVVFLAAGSQPALRFALAQAKAAGFEIDAKTLRGNLFFGVEAVDATVKSAFINGSSASVKAKYNLLTLLQKKELRLEGIVSGGRLSFDPSKLPPVVAGSEPPPISVFLDKAEIADTQLEFIGKHIFVPDAKVTVLSHSPLSSQDGKIRGNLRVKLESKDGGGFATALYEFGKDFDPNLVIDTQLDAAVANYWLKPIPMDIQGGQLRGTVRVTAKGVTADATLQDGMIQVLPGLVAKNIAGLASFDSSGQVKAKLNGQGLGGAIQADFVLDTTPKKEQWKVSGKLYPRLEAIMKTFAAGTPGKGALEVTVSGGGWEKIKLTGTAKGLGVLEAAGFPVQNLLGSWQFTDHLEGNATAKTRIGADELNVVADVKTIGDKILITPELTGNFLNAPLELAANINVLGGKIGIDTSGTILRGSANAKIKLEGEKISGNGTFKAVQLPIPEPVTSSINATAKVSGTVSNMLIAGYLNPANIKIPAVKLDNLAGAYKLRFDGKALTAEANLADGAIVANGALVNVDGKPARGNVFLRGVRLDVGGQADYAAQYVLNSAGVAFSGIAKGYDLKFSEARLDDLSGVLTLSVGQQIKGRWNANKLLATFTEKTINLRPRAWRVQAVGESAFVSGDMTLTYEGLRTSGRLEGKTRFGTITALGQGSSIGLSGNAGFSGIRAALSGALTLEPFDLRLAAVPQNKNLGGKLLLEANQKVQVSGNLTSNGQNLVLGFDDAGLSAKGRLDLAALAPVLPKDAQNILSGIADIDLSGSSGTALVRGSVAGIPLEANLSSNNLKVSATARVTGGQFAGATLRGRVFPSLAAQVQYGNLTGRVSGAYDNIGFTGSGKLPDSLLEGTGLSLSSSQLAVRGRIRNGLISAAGQVGGLNIQNARLENGRLSAGFSGSVVGTYQNEALRLNGLNGKLEQVAAGFKVSVTARAASAVLAGNPINASGVVANLEPQSGGANLIRFEVDSANGIFSGVKTQVSKARGVLNLRGDLLGLEAQATRAVAQTAQGLVVASGIQASSNGTLDRLPIRFTATQLEGTGFGAKAVLNQVKGTVALAQSLSFNADFASGKVQHPEANGSLGAGSVSGNLRGDNLETRFDFNNISATTRGEKITGNAKGNLGLNLAKPIQNWRGTLEAALTGVDWKLGATGNWQNLRVSGNVPTRLSSLAGFKLPDFVQTKITLNGTLSLPDLHYDLELVSSLRNLRLKGSLKGKETNFAARVDATDKQNGRGVIEYNSSGTAALQLENLDVSALVQTSAKLSGDLRLALGELNLARRKSVSSYELPHARSSRFPLKEGGLKTKPQGLDLAFDLSTPLRGASSPSGAILRARRVERSERPSPSGAILRARRVERSERPSPSGASFGSREGECSNCAPATLTLSKLMTAKNSIRGKLEGEIAGFPITASWLENDAFAGRIGGVLPMQVRSAQWLFPLETILEVKSEQSDLPIRASARFNLAKLRGEGTLEVLAYSQKLADGQVSLVPQTMPFQVALQDGLRLRLENKAGAVRLNNDTWSGQLGLAYTAFAQNGTVMARVSGALAKPNLNLSSTGLLQLQGSGDLETARVSGRVLLQPLLGSLPKELQTGLSAGSAQLEATWAAGTLGFKARLENTQLDKEVVQLSLTGALKDSSWNAKGDLKVGSSLSSFEVSDAGVQASQLNLDLRLARLFGLDFSGRVQGRASFPKYDLAQLEADLTVQNARGFGVSADGSLQARAGEISADLKGNSPLNLEYKVVGALYPNLDAALQLGQLSGRASGRGLDSAKRTANLILNGQFLEKTSSLGAQLLGDDLSLQATWDAAKLQAIGKISDFSATGALEIPDLKGIAGVAGNASAQLEYRNSILNISEIAADAAGYKASGAAQFADGQLRLEQFNVLGDGVTASGSGQLYPKLEAKGTAKTTFDFAPTDLTWTALGSLEKPKLEVKGMLNEASLGLIAPNTPLEAKFDGEKWQLVLSGAAVSGQLEGSLQEVSSVDLRLNAPIVYQENRLAARGNIGWSNAAGFSGELSLLGRLFGQTGGLNLVGKQQLEVSTSWQDLRLRATLPSQIGAELQAELQLERVDLGALYGQPKTVWLEGRGTASGAWTAPELAFDGSLESKDKVLNSSLKLSYAAGAANAKLVGEQLNAAANWKNGVWSASAKLGKLSLEPYLPKDLLPKEIRALALAGGFTASGNEKTWQVKATNLDASAQADWLGAVRVQGDASLSPENLSSKLKLETLNGQADISAEIQNPLEVDQAKLSFKANLQKLDATQLEQLDWRGLVSGDVQLEGRLLDPEVKSSLEVEEVGLKNESWRVSSSLDATGRLLNPSLNGKATLSGSGKGSFAFAAAEVLSNNPKVMFNGLAEIPSVRVQGLLEGALPALRGQVQVKAEQLPEPVQLEGLGDGQYKVSSAGLANGTVQLSSQQSWLESALSGKIRVSGNTNAFVDGFSATVLGDVVLSGRLQKPMVQLENTSLTRDDAMLLSSGSLYPTLDLRGSLESRLEFAPARLSYSVTGDFAKPDVRLSGVLGTAQVGLIAPDTQLEAQFDGQKWRVDLRGQSLSGVLEGQLISLSRADLKLNAPIVYNNERLNADGNLSWDATAGFGGNLVLLGKLFDQDTKLELVGNDRLDAILRWKNGLLKASLPSPSAEKLMASWELETFDLGAWWQKPEQLFLSGKGQATGTWSDPQLEFAGALKSSEGSLDAKLTASYLEGLVKAKLEGEKTKFSGQYQDGVWQATGSLNKVSLGAVLPTLVKSLETSFDLTAKGDTKGVSVNLTKLETTGKLETFGAFAGTGAAQLEGVYTNLGLDGKLSVQNLELNALGGRAKLNGQLGTSRNASMFLGLENLNLESLGWQGVVGGNLDLSGTLSKPMVSGDLRGAGLGLKNETWSADASLAVSREVFNPELSGYLELRGSGSGKVNIAASELFSSRLNLAISGAAKLPFLDAKGSLAGTFPDLRGQLEVNLPTAPIALRQIRLEGVGSNRLQVAVQDVFQGQLELIPAKTLLGTGLKGSFTVNALLETALEGLVAGADGNLRGQLEVGGSLEQPQVNLLGTLKNAGLSGVKLGDASISAELQNGLAARLRFKEGEIKLEENRLSANGVPLEVAGVRLALAATGRVSPFDLNFSSAISGIATGNLEGRYVDDKLGLNLKLLTNGIEAVASANANPKTGWTGQIALSNLPKAAPISGKALNGTAQFTLSGDFANPSIKGRGDAYGAKFNLSANLAPLRANLELLEAGSGTVLLENNRLSGGLKYQDDALSLELGVSGSLSIPSANLIAKVGALSATAKARLENNQISATLDLSDGKDSGRLIYDNSRVTGQIKNLSLGSMGLVGYTGELNLSTDLRQDASSDFGWAGTGVLDWDGLNTPFEVPSLGWKVDGSGRATLATNPVRVLLEYKGTPGLAEGDLRFQKGLWQGDVNLDLRGAEGKGAVKGTVRADEKGITGDLTAQNLPISYSGIRATVSGKVDLDGDSFQLSGSGKALGGDVRLDGNGGLADLIPLLESYTKTQPGDLPINLNASLFTVRLQDLAQIRSFAPYIQGRVNGKLNIVGDVTAFDITQSELNLPDQNGKRMKLAVRIRGTLAGNQVNYTGSISDSLNPNPNVEAPSLAGIGTSRFSGRFNGKVATGTLELSRAPLHAFAASVLGEMPGTALATGFARYEIPVDNFLASTIKMDFVPLEITGGGDVLTGKGRLIYSNGNLQFDDLILRGKGEWRINGHYAKDNVDLGMSFKNTVFTPILDLIPQIKEYDPRATGSLDLKLSGKYGAPNAKLSLKDLKGSISGIQLTAKELLGSLNNGNLELRGILTSDDSLGATLDTTAKAKLISYTPIQLEDLEGLATGSLNVKPIGLIGGIKARLFGDSGGFKLDLTAKKGGDLSIRGDISPRIKLKLEGKALVMPIPDYFVSDSLLDASLSFEGDGGRFYDVGGQLSISRLQAQLQQNNSSKPTQSNTPTSSTPSKPNPFLQQVRFRGIEVVAPQGLRVSESFATLEAGGKLTVTGTMANPELSGALEAVGGSGGRGTVRLGINNYTIQTAVAAFSPIEGIFPNIEIKSKGEVKASCTTEAATPVTNIVPIPIDLTIKVRWLADSKNPSIKRIDVQPTVDGNCPTNQNYRPLGAAELYSLVTLGSSNANLGGLAQQSLDTVLSVFILGELTRQIKAATGIDIDFRSNFIEVVAQNISDPNAQAVINFTLNFGIDLSRALRLNVQLNNNRFDSSSKSQLLGGAINLNWQSDDGRFGIRLGTPFYLPNATSSSTLGVFDIIQPEAQFSFNISNTVGLTLTTAIPAANQFRISFGVSLRF